MKDTFHERGFPAAADLQVGVKLSEALLDQAGEQGGNNPLFPDIAGDCGPECPLRPDGDRERCRYRQLEAPPDLSMLCHRHGSCSAQSLSSPDPRDVGPPEIEIQLSVRPCPVNFTPGKSGRAVQFQLLSRQYRTFSPSAEHTCQPDVTGEPGLEQRQIDSRQIRRHVPPVRHDHAERSGGEKGPFQAAARRRLEFYPDVQPLFAAGNGDKALLHGNAPAPRRDRSACRCAPVQRQPLSGTEVQPDGAAAPSGKLFILQIGIGPGEVHSGPVHPERTAQRLPGQFGGDLHALRSDPFDEKGGKGNIPGADRNRSGCRQVPRPGAVPPFEAGNLSPPDSGTVSAGQGQQRTGAG